MHKPRELEFLHLPKLFAKIKEGLDHNPNLPHWVIFFCLVVHFEWNGKSLDSPEGLSYKKVTVLKIATGQVHAFQENPNYDGHLILFTEKFVLNYFSKSTIEFIPPSLQLSY